MTKMKKKDVPLPTSASSPNLTTKVAVAILDDNQSSRLIHISLLKKIFIEGCYDVREYSDGSIASYEKFKAFIDPYQHIFVISDCHMISSQHDPLGEGNGPHFLKKLHAEKNKSKHYISILSSDGFSPENKHDSIDLFIPKPLGQKNITTGINTLINDGHIKLPWFNLLLKTFKPRPHSVSIKSFSLDYHTVPTISDPPVQQDDTQKNKNDQIEKVRQSLSSPSIVKLRISHQPKIKN